MRPSGLDLLYVFDALVRRDAAASGLSGSIAFGVDDRWWRVELDGVARAQFLDARPVATSTVSLSEATADAILEGRPLPEGVNSFEVKGDSRLVDRFVARYVRRQGAHQLSRAK